MTGVMPDPPLSSRTGAVGRSGTVSSPSGGEMVTTVPGRSAVFTWPETRPSGMCLTVMVRCPSPRRADELME